MAGPAKPSAVVRATTFPKGIGKHEPYTFAGYKNPVIDTLASMVYCLSADAAGLPDTRVPEHLKRRGK